MKAIYTIASIALLNLFIISCQKKDISTDTSTNTNPVTNINKISPDGFGFANSRLVNVQVQLKTNYGSPVPNVLVRMYDAAIASNYSLESDSARTILFQGVTNANGVLEGKILLKSTTDTLLVDPNYVGLARNVKCYFKNNNLTATIGATNNLSGNVVGYNIDNYIKHVDATHMTFGNGQTPQTFGVNDPWAKPSFKYFNNAATCNWDKNGVPLYLDPVNDEISSALLSGINASIPEYGHVPMIHPEYFENTVPTDLAITKDADIYIGFLYAGTSARNTLGYYLYPTNNPPQKPADITEIYYVFPNAQQPAYHAGQVVTVPGNRVRVGNVKAGMSIGFFCIGGGWNSSNPTTPNIGGTIYYSNPNMNPENDPSRLNPAPVRHSVIINNAGFKHFVVGFEDSYNPNLQPTNSGNNDFNDAVVYVTSTPIEAIDNKKVPSIANAIDTDSDGVPDTYDAYPSDVTKAYVNYYPSKDTYGYVAFEDNFPLKGDYDMNDLVVKYQYKIVSNAQNNIVEMNASYIPIAAGAVYKNGFGVQLPFAASKVAKVTGQRLNNNYITLAANGTEANQINAVIIPFDSYANLINNNAGAAFINTQANMPKATGASADVYVQFTTPISPAEFGQAPFDMFCISNMRRGYEIHLPNYPPTALVNKILFGTNDDASNAGRGIYYVSSENWPWAINFTQPFSYPIETANIKDTYLHFLDWAKSGGTQYIDWFTNNGTDYRANANIYNK